MSNIRTLSIKKHQTFIEVLEKYIGQMTDEEKELEFQAGMLVVQTTEGLVYVPLDGDTTLYTFIGMLEAIKSSIIEEMK